MRVGSIEEPSLVVCPAADFTSVYRDWFTSVVVWLRALGTPSSEIEDVAQEAFLVVRRKLAAFDGRNLPGWLYKIAAQTASDQRRRAWFRRLVFRASDSELDELPTATPDPLRSCEIAHAQRELGRLLAELKEQQRVVFWLFEIEGYSTSEIAGVVGATESAVSMRLHYARKELHRRIEQQRRKERS
ncbi:MAG TPA: sigma-70 family RNA polymerase sigma factor [Polyangia bacterium]